MRINVAIILLLGSTATAHAEPGLLDGLLSGLGLSSQSQKLRSDLKSGFNQFQPLISGGLFGTLSTTLSTLLNTLPGGTAISSPIVSALSAAQLAASQSDKAALANAQRCLKDIIAKGGIPSGSVCVDSGKNTIDAYATAFNTYLEQFVGIVPPNVATAIQNKEKEMFAQLGLIPPANDLNNHINNAISSVIASTSGETVTAIERLEDCFAEAIKSGKLDTTKKCITAPQSGLTSLFTLMSGVTQQFVGYLPPNVVNDLINMYNYQLSKSGVTAGLGLQRTFQNAIESIAASTSGNTATMLQQVLNCYSDLIMSSDPSSLPACTVAKGGPIFTLQVTVNSIIQQAFGYLPPTTVIELEKELDPYLSKSDPDQEQIEKVFQAFFQTASLGPKFVTCVEALEDCVNDGVLGVSTTCDLSGKCKALASP